jgi:AraC-like DNA-binding protein
MKRRAALAGPLQVAAIDVPGTPPRGLPARAARLLKLHKGIAYLVWRDDANRALKAMHRAGYTTGEPQPCAGAGDLLRAIQQAVLSLRQAMLGTIGSPLTRYAEEQARTLALSRLRQTGTADDALHAFVQIVLHRHQRKLGTVRRKLIEALCLLTIDQDTAGEVSDAFHRAIVRLMETFNIVEMRSTFESIVKDLLPRLRRASSADETLVGQAQRFIDAHFTESIGLQQVADHLRCSPTHLSRAYAQATRETLTAHLQSLRVTRAKQLLRETDSPLRVIGPAAGFQSSKHFHRVFRRLTGMTPAAFRGV